MVAWDHAYVRQAGTSACAACGHGGLYSVGHATSTGKCQECFESTHAMSNPLGAWG